MAQIPVQPPFNGQQGVNYPGGGPYMGMPSTPGFSNASAAPFPNNGQVYPGQSQGVPMQASFAGGSSAYGPGGGSMSHPSPGGVMYNPTTGGVLYNPSPGAAMFNPNQAPYAKPPQFAGAPPGMTKESMQYVPGMIPDSRGFNPKWSFRDSFGNRRSRCCTIS